MSLSVKNSLSLSLSVSYIYVRFSLACRHVAHLPRVNAYQTRLSPSSRFSVPRRVDSLYLPIRIRRSFLFFFAKFLSFGSKSTANKDLVSPRGERPGVASGRRFDEYVPFSLSFHLPTVYIYVYLSSIACRRSLLLIRLLKFLNVIVYFIPSIVTVLLSLSDRPLSVCPCLFVTPSFHFISVSVPYDVSLPPVSFLFVGTEEKCLQMFYS